MGSFFHYDFSLGERVYHLSNSKLIMVVVKINNDLDEITCRWIDKEGNIHVEVFLIQELGKVSDLSS